MQIIVTQSAGGWGAHNSAGSAGNREWAGMILDQQGLVDWSWSATDLITLFG